MLNSRHAAAKLRRRISKIGLTVFHHANHNAETRVDENGFRVVRYISRQELLIPKDKTFDKDALPPTWKKSRISASQVNVES